jgi:mannosyltransferase OCH1-like enzyme
MIPRTIHYCWFGKNRKSDCIRRCMKSWNRILPGYTIREWNESNIPFDTAYVRETYSQKQWSRLSNYVRLYALNTHGGIYLDTDMEVLKSLDPLLVDDGFLGFQLEQHPTDSVDWVNSAIFGCRAGHPFLKKCMDLTTRLFETEGQFYRSPTVITTALKEVGLKEYGMQVLDGIRLYPVEYFYPFSWLEIFSPECIGSNTYCVHYWEASWLQTPSEGRPQGVWRKLKQLIRKG